MKYQHFPHNQGLYSQEFEHDSCGVGFLCHIKGYKSHQLVSQALATLNRLTHRGAVGADPKTGDGAGILVQIPHEFFSLVCNQEKIKLPNQGEYGVGLVFLPQKDSQKIKDILATLVTKRGLTVLGWRKVPVNNTSLGQAACHTQPTIEQIFISKNKEIKDELAFERILYVIRKEAENTIRNLNLNSDKFFYITSLSCRTIIYKGLLMPQQLENFFLDFSQPSFKSALALIHSRYSTNTFPTWDLAQPFRFLAHNGEINTLRGNINWMKARENLLNSDLFGKDIEHLKPVIVPGGSDSAAIDNVLELLVLSGRPIEQAMMMLVPPAWENNPSITEEIKDFYKYHACLIEPWDGPAAIAFTDGISIGAVLDRNGLRPARYIITKDDLVVMASEVGAFLVQPENIASSGRIKPGRIFFVNTQAGKIMSDNEIKTKVAQENPYGLWLKEKFINLEDLKIIDSTKEKDKVDFITKLKTFAYTREDLNMTIAVMGQSGEEPIGSMGNDTAHALLANQPQLLYRYFKQLFAQVTNPPIDPIREEIVMSLNSFLGPEKNLLTTSKEHCHKLYVKNPILTNQQLDKIRFIKENSFKTKTINYLFDINKNLTLPEILDDICKQVLTAIEEKNSFIILSDRGITANFAPLPALLVIGRVHHYLVAKGLRTQVGLILETGEPREVHHFALLFGYGADCINPYLAYETIEYLVKEKDIENDLTKALENYRQAVKKGILKILSKMGISTLQSYRGAQIFEALGIAQEVIDKCFIGTPSRISGIDFAIIKEEILMVHNQAWGKPISQKDSPIANTVNILPSGGVYKWRRDGQTHLWNPETIAALQDSVRTNNYSRYQEFAGMINDQSKNPVTLRSLLKFKSTIGIPIEKVETIDNIVKRFATGAMSFGSISAQAHQALAIAMNKIGAKSNTGEGGEDPARFYPLPNGESRRSAIKQVASGRFGVTTNYLVNADELQIKIAQGAKPGEGGQLPGHKVSAIIAKTRYTTQGVTLISPPPHHDIYSIEDLAQLIFDLKNVNPKARISVKLVSEVGVGTVAAGVAKGHADMILISGGDGGTGASPLSSIFNAGLPWELGLSETHQTLVLNGLRNRVRLQTDGQMRTGHDVAIAAILGAEEYGFCTAALITLGCVMLRHCHLNNCALGVATQDEILEKRFKGRPEYVINYMYFIAQELRQIMAQLGVNNLNDLIGRTDLLEVNSAIIPWKANKIDYSKILYSPQVKSHNECYCNQAQDHGIEQVLDHQLIALAKPALEEKKIVNINLTIENFNRSTGAMLSGKVCKIYGEDGLISDTINCKFTGVAGQSFGAFLMKGITFELEGLANDYVGKAISGGKIIIYPWAKADYTDGENIVVGNTSFYGAISGEAYIRGVAGERFCIRNSGLYTVVEGVGDHGCEYMTGGRVLVLGKTGRNFAAGMSGGIAYIYDINNFREKCNLTMVELETIDEDDKKLIYNLLNNHYRYTQSPIAKDILLNYSQEITRFIKVMPLEYKRILEAKKIEQKLELNTQSDG